jgi:hypothetical protein
MKFLTKVIAVTSDRLENDIKLFISEDSFYKHNKKPQDFTGKCDGVATDLYYFLKDKDYEVKLIMGVGFKGKLPAHFSAHYKQAGLDVPEPQYVSHVVVVVGNTVIDLTGGQFGFKNQRLLSLTQFKKEWDVIKPFKPWKR